LGVDLAGEAVDVENDRETCPDASCSLARFLPLVGRARTPLPARGNRTLGADDVTAVVVQHPEDGVEDGHEIVFQREEAKAQYREFLETWLDGVPSVPEP
jgi:hypothetical protein